MILHFPREILRKILKRLKGTPIIKTELQNGKRMAVLQNEYRIFLYIMKFMFNTPKRFNNI